MSKSNIRKITVDSTKCNTDSRRPSVFERLGTKPVATGGQVTSDYCRNWALNGSCSYGKTCKYANTHTLISPSKRVKKDTANASAPVTKEDPFKRVTSKIVKKTSHSPDLNLEEWNQTDLEYEDEKVLERRRQLLQRELELQMKKDKEVHTKDRPKHKKKMITSSSSSHSSSTSSSSSSSSSEDSSTSSSSSSRKKLKKIKQKRAHSPGSDYEDDKDRKKKLKLKRLTKTDKIPKKKRKLELSPSKKEVPKPSKKPAVSQRKHVTTNSKSPPKPKDSLNRSLSPTKPKRDPSKDQKRLPRESPDPKRSKDPEKPKSVTKQKSKSKERRSRTPPKPQKSPLLMKRRSRTPEKRQKRESPRPKPSSTPSRALPNPCRPSMTPSKPKDREVHKLDRKDREEFKKIEQIKPRSLPEDPRKPFTRDLDEKRRLKDHRDDRKPSHDFRDEKMHSRRDKEREDRPRDDRRDMKDQKMTPPPLLDKRYLRDTLKEKPKDLPQKDDKLPNRDRRNDRERDRNPQKFEKYDKGFRQSPEKNLEREIYDRNRHRRFQRFDDRKDKEMNLKIERRESPRGPEDRNFDRNYQRMNDWENNEDHFHEDEGRRKNEGRRFNSPFAERRGRGEDVRRFPERNFEEHYHQEGKMRPREDEKWEGDHNRSYPVPSTPGDWEDRDWNASRGRQNPRVDNNWERESVPRSDAHEDDWNRFSPMSEWKINDSGNRKWENPHLRGNFRGETHQVDKRRGYGTPEVEGGSHGSKHSSLHGSMKEEPINKKLMEMAEGRPRRSREKSVDSFGKKGGVKEKSGGPGGLGAGPGAGPGGPVNLPEAKEPPEPKRICLDESVAHHTESDLSDISDDPDDILEMEDEEKMIIEEKESVLMVQETENSSENVPEDVFNKEEEKEKEKEEIEEDNIEGMDFEEISDGELEEDIKTSGKGLGDALGVDWESLVKETQPRRSERDGEDEAQGRWQCKAIFQRIGVSKRFAGDEFVQKICGKYGEFLMSDVAMVHAGMWREKVLGGGESDGEDEEVLKPFVGLFEEAQRILEGSC